MDYSKRLFLAIARLRIEQFDQIDAEADAVEIPVQLTRGDDYVGISQLYGVIGRVKDKRRTRVFWTTHFEIRGSEDVKSIAH